MEQFLDQATAAMSERGFFVLPALLSPAEVESWTAIFDRDHQTYPSFWRDVSGHYLSNFDVLVTSPEIDGFVRHRVLLPLVRGLMGGLVQVADLMFSFKAAHAGTPYAGWHRDCDKLATHPLGLMHLQAMAYLTDVGPDTHCFSVAGEPAGAACTDEIEIGDPLARPAGAVDVLGPAGTVILFNPAVAHGATTRVTSAVRKTMHVYFGHRGGPYALYDESVIPPSFSCHADPEVRELYGARNQRTAAFLAAFGPGTDGP